MVTEFKLPELGENIEAGDVVNILLSVGDTVEINQPVLEIETNKATIEVPSTIKGVVKKIYIKADARVRVGQVIFTAETTNDEPVQKIVLLSQKETSSTPSKNLAPPPATITSRPQSNLAPASPTVRRLARELGVDINRVPGSGVGGRISKTDVKNHVRKINTEIRPTENLSAMPTLPPLPDFSRWGEIDHQQMNNIRRITAKHTANIWSTIPHVTNFDKADITELEKLRKRYAKKAETAGGKLTITAMILKVVASALKRFPKINATVDIANQQIIYKRYYHIGVAVDTERGLLVPVIRDVEQKTIIELSVELTEIARKARERKTTLEDMRGGTFTLTNLGGIGGTNFTPIINHPEVAILGVSRSNVEAVFKNGGFEPRLILPLALSYDHRLVDGADAAHFLRWVAEALEQPFLLSLEG